MSSWCGRQCGAQKNHRGGSFSIHSEHKTTPRTPLLLDNKRCDEEMSIKCPNGRTHIIFNEVNNSPIINAKWWICHCHGDNNTMRESPRATVLECSKSLVMYVVARWQLCGSFVVCGRGVLLWSREYSATSSWPYLKLESRLTPSWKWNIKHIVSTGIPSLILLPFICKPRDSVANGTRSIRWLPPYNSTGQGQSSRSHLWRHSIQHQVRWRDQPLMAVWK